MSNITERLRSYLSRGEFVETLNAMAPPQTDVGRVANAYINAVATDPKLQRFDLSIHIAALTKCVRMGLHPGPLNHVYLIAQRGIVDAVPSYKGLIARIKRQPNVRSVQAHTVHEADSFKMTAGTTPKIDHEVKLGERGPFRGVYAIVFYVDGSYQFDYMTAAEVEQIRANTQGGRGGASPWAKWFDQMAKKSIVKRLISFMGFEDSALGAITEIDEEKTETIDPLPEVETESELGAILDHSSA